MANALLRWIEDLQDVLTGLPDVELPERGRETIKIAIKRELSKAIDEFDLVESKRNSYKKWSEEELKILDDYLKGKVANTWHQSNAHLEDVALKLKRSRNAVRDKAIELGHREAIDYWYNNLG